MKFKRKMSSQTPEKKQESSGPSILRSLAHGAASGVGIGVGLEGVRQASNAIFSDKPEPAQEKPEPVQEKPNCEFLYKLFSMKCEKSDEDKEFCMKLYEKLEDKCGFNEFLT